jgi:hypothetical protein
LQIRTCNSADSLNSSLESKRNITQTLKLSRLAFSNQLFTGGVKTERVFPGLSVLRKNKKMEVLYPEKKVKIGPMLERSPAIRAGALARDKRVFPGLVLPKTQCILEVLYPEK